MNPTLKKKFPLIILLVIVIGIVFFLSNNNQQESISTFGFGFRNLNQIWTSSVTLTDPGNNTGSTTNQVTAVDPTGYDTDGNQPYPTESSGTCFKEIKNPDKVYTGTTDSNLAYKLDDDNSKSTNSLYTGGPNASKSEFGLFNAIMQSNKLITAFMNNNYSWIPYSISVIPAAAGGTTFKASILSGDLKGTILYSYVSTPTSGALTLSTAPATTGLTPVWGSAQSTCTLNQALYIPSTTGTTSINTVGGGNFGATQRTITTTATIPSGTTIMLNPQKYRAKLILGVLVANHMVLNSSPPNGTTYEVPVGGNFVNESKVSYVQNSVTYYGLLADLYKNYNPAIFSATAPSTWNNAFPWPGVGKSADTGYNLTYNSIHAVFLYVLARDAWLGEMINNILKI
jgi:hypothetical protein